MYKLSLTSGASCPNRDGTLSTGGCIFCSEGGSGDFAAKAPTIREQIAEAKSRVDAKFSSKIPPEERRYIAYFQSYTNTYGNQDYLKSIFSEAAEYPEIVGLSVGTRPDCLEDEMIEYLSGLNRKKEVWLELGLQTIHERTARFINRAYPLSVFEDAYKRLTDAGLKVVVHMILGLPGETEEDMLESIRYLSGLTPTPFGVKLQLLHILRGTKLADIYEKEPFHVFSLEEYCSLVAKCLKVLPAETVIHRLTGDGPKRLLIEPKWSGDKKRVMNAINAAIANTRR